MEKQIKATTCETNYSTTTTIILNEAPNAFYNSYKKTAGTITDSDGVFNIETKENIEHLLRLKKRTALVDLPEPSVGEIAFV